MVNTKYQISNIIRVFIPYPPPILLVSEVYKSQHTQPEINCWCYKFSKTVTKKAILFIQLGSLPCAYPQSLDLATPCRGMAKQSPKKKG